VAGLGERLLRENQLPGPSDAQPIFLAVIDDHDLPLTVEERSRRDAPHVARSREIVVSRVNKLKLLLPIVRHVKNPASSIRYT
jgi:hypothetical protein